MFAFFSPVRALFFVSYFGLFFSLPYSFPAVVRAAGGIVRFKVLQIPLVAWVTYTPATPYARISWARLWPDWTISYRAPFFFPPFFLFC